MSFTYKKYVARHKETGEEQTFKYVSLALARKRNPDFVGWREAE